MKYDFSGLYEAIGYTFKNEGLIINALTHTSFANEKCAISNERLEFLGDSILGMVTAKRLFEHTPPISEGQMTRIRSELVCEAALARVASGLNLGAYLRLGKGEEQTGGRQRHSVTADCVEAVIAAIYTDGGFEEAKKFIDRFVLEGWESHIKESPADYKTVLQELSQRIPGNTPRYEIIGAEGPDHMKEFTARVLIGGEEAGTGKGRSKKDAEQMAAAEALSRMEKEEEK